MDIISGVVLAQGWWHRYGYAISLFYECYISMMHGPRPTAGWITPQPTPWHPTTPQTYLGCYYPGFSLKSLNNVPHQWCSFPRLMIHVWICCPTVLWTLYEACTTSDRGGSPHRPQYQIELNWIEEHLCSINRGIGLVVTWSAHNPTDPEFEWLCRGREDVFYCHGQA